MEQIQISIASPEVIRKWSYGEVLRPDTINYRTQKPEREGLFCERIFGPTRDYECSCGKYKGQKYQGIICERCGVEITSSKVRRERMGHIELAAKVAHIWFYKVPPSTIGLLLDLPQNVVERIVYYEDYIVVRGGNGYKKGEVISEEEAIEIKSKIGGEIVVDTGSEALYNLLKDLNLEEESADITLKLRMETSPEKRSKLLKRLDVIEGFRLSGTRPEWTIIEVLPVIPPDLRPLLPLEGGRYASSDLNDLYRRIITRNNRLKHLKMSKTPDIIIKNECRLLQEAVDALLDNSRKVNPVKSRGGIPLKSLSDILRGKQGRFRKNLLGKRVDYSGRSVIVVDPQLKLYECGLPKSMAIELFKPFITKELERSGYVETIRGANKLLESGSREVWEILEKVTRNYPVLLNRAPTLHRLSIQTFYPKLVEGSAIRISPLVCVPFNADFDGDQMAVHVPLSSESLIESMVLMLSSNNILSPAHGDPITIPTQDIIIGIYWLTKEKRGEKGEGKQFSSIEEIYLALEKGVVSIHSEIKYWEGSRWIKTTVGRVILNEIIPEGIGYINRPMDKKSIIQLIGTISKKIGNYAAVHFLDKIKEIGYKYATESGLTIGIDDMKIPTNKKEIIEKAYKEIEVVEEEYKSGIITDSERYNTVLDIWTSAVNQIEKEAIEYLEKDKSGFNPLYMMANSGARGNMEQLRQIVAVRGLMTRPGAKDRKEEIMETPVISSFLEGLNVIEYFISSHGARKGLTDTALKTAQAGYLTRKLVDVAQDVIITEEDCGTIMGIKARAIKEGEEIIQPLSKRIRGKFALEDVIDPITSQVIVFAGEEITDEKAEEIENSGIDSVYIRSVLTCESKKGLCRKCYGRDLARNKLVELGEPVGVVAAQSIGEPGTQLTLRTFHVGGVASKIATESQKKAPFKGKIEFENIKIANKKVVLNKEGKIHLKGEKTKITYKVPYGATIFVKNKEIVDTGRVLFEWDPYSISIISEEEGTVKYVNLIENVTYRLEYDEKTGRKEPVIMAYRKISPEIEIYQENNKVANYLLPVKAHVLVKDGAKVLPGDTLAKIPKEITKTRDITGGLPRVIDLFEARHPKDKAVVTEIDGIVEIKILKEGERVVIVKGTYESREYKIQYGKHIIVRNGEEVKACDKLTEGPIDPHDVLRIKGVQETQEFLVNQIQEVYKLQGVEIADTHISIIVRQMLSKVKINDPGDTMFVYGQIVDKIKLKEENKKVMEAGGKGATFEPVLLGITQSILSSDSFISAASFQETTRVLTEAAIHTKIDYLTGLKENVIIGSLIPAGTGTKKFREEYANNKSINKEEKEKSN